PGISTPSLHDALPIWEGRTIIESLWSHYTSGGAGHAAVGARLSAAQGTTGDPASFDRLHTLLEAQPYRLAFWKVAAERTTYRRLDRKSTRLNSSHVKI